MKTNTSKTSKKKLVVNWPNTAFTIDQLQSQYPTAKNITLRFRVKRSLGSNELTVIGKNSGSVGRPTLVFAKAPVTKEVLAAAVKANVVLDEQFSKSLTPVAQFTPTTPMETAKTEVTTTTPAKTGKKETVTA
jgi:hypothetical protein